MLPSLAILALISTVGVHMRFSAVHNGTLYAVVEVEVPLVGGIRTVVGQFCFVGEKS